MRAAARLRAQRIDPADHPLVELLVQTHRVVHPRALLEQSGQNLVDIGDRKGVVGAVILDRARGARALAIPDLAFAVAFAYEQHIFRHRTPGDQYRHCIRLIEAAQVVKVAVLPVVVLDIVVPLARRCRRQDRNRIAPHQPHQLRTPAREFAFDWIGHEYLGDRSCSLVQDVSRWDVSLAQRLQLVEYQLHADAYELGQFRQRGFIGFLAVGRIDAGARDLGQVAHDFAEFSGQALRIGGAAGAPPQGETGTPRGQRLGALLDWPVVPGDQQVEVHTVSGQRRDRSLIKCLQYRIGVPGASTSVREYLRQPILETVRDQRT